MLKYTDTQVVFEEIPDEVTLAINISNCPHHCKGCHSPYLREDIGEVLYGDTLVNMVTSNYGIRCILFMGEGRDEEALIHLIELIRHLWGREMKIGLYTGAENVSPYLWENLDYIKLGPYIEERGPLNNPNTNQRLYKWVKDWDFETDSGTVINGIHHPRWTDITYRFWRKGTE